MAVLQCPHRKYTGNIPSNAWNSLRKPRDLYVKSALTELAEEFKKQAEKIKDR